MGAHTKEQLKELRDLLIKDRNDSKHSFEKYSKTVSYIYDLLCFMTNIYDMKTSMRKSAESVRGLPINPDSETDYTLAYDLIFGDISAAPLHINDALDTIALWRLRQP